MSSGFTNFLSLQFLLPLITIAVYVMGIIIGLDCIWRVEKRLDLFLKVLVSGFALEVIRMVARIGGFAESAHWITIVWIADFLSGVLFLIALLIMYQIIRSLNLEKPKPR